MKLILDVSAYQDAKQLDSLLMNSPDEIAGVYIKLTQGNVYKDELVPEFVRVCHSHNTPYGFYHFMTNVETQEQCEFFKQALSEYSPELLHALDCEGVYDLYQKGLDNFMNHFSSEGGSEFLIYFSESMADYYSHEEKRWAAQYPYNGPISLGSLSLARIQDKQNAGYLLWQYTNCYEGMNQDASMLLGDFESLKLH